MRCSREYLSQGLSALGYRVVPTSANFLFCDLGEDAAADADRLQDEGVAVRPLGPWGAPNCIRVTIGTAEQNQAFLQAAQRVVARGFGTGTQMSGLAREDREYLVPDNCSQNRPFR